MGIEYLIISSIGAIIGSIVVNIYHYMRTSSGTLRIDHSNPDKDVYRIELDDLDNLSKKKRIVLQVDNNAELSQK